MINESAGPTSIEMIDGRLRYVTRLMRATSLMVVLLTVGEFAVAGYFFTQLSAPFPPVPTVLMVAAMAIMSAAFFDHLRRRGDALFTELSDEFQWSDRSDVSPVKPPIEVRVTLRQFTSASDLPLLPGRYGPAIYVLLDIGIGLLTTYLVRIGM